MSDVPPKEPATADRSAGPDLPTVDIRDVEDWKVPPEVTFHQAASLEIARWVLGTFVGVYTLCFLVAFITLFWLPGGTFNNALEVIKFMVGSILPLATLAVGYYLGERRALEQQQ